MAGDDRPSEPSFDRVLTSPIQLTPPDAFRFRSLSEMLLRQEGEAIDRQAVLVGDVDGDERVVTVADLRHAAIRIRRWPSK